MMTPSPIIQTKQLYEILQQPHLRVIDCRFDLVKPTWGKEGYSQAHIPGAIFADLNLDISSSPTATTGRHPLPDPQTFVEKLANWNISPETQAVVYDTGGGGFAGRLWWMLRAIGHQNVQLLDGGFTQWQRDMLPVSSGIETVPVGQFRYRPEFNQGRHITSQEVFSAFQDPNIRLIDARAPERFQGLSEPIDPVAGHIPGALNRFYGDNLTPEGTFKPASQLRQEFTSLLGDISTDQTIVYCGSGVTSCHHLIAMEIAGLPVAKIYLGSWSEWIRDPDRPIASGK